MDWTKHLDWLTSRATSFEAHYTLHDLETMAEFMKQVWHLQQCMSEFDLNRFNKTLSQTNKERLAYIEKCMNTATMKKKLAELKKAGSERVADIAFLEVELERLSKD